MARQGLPATFSKESMELVPYWEREIKESPRMVSIIEKDVNNAVEVLDRLEKNIKPDYKKIVGMKAEKQVLNKSDYTIIKKINEFPNIDTKEIVVVKDTVNKKASVILPQGASLEKTTKYQECARTESRTLSARKALRLRSSIMQVVALA